MAKLLSVVLALISCTWGEPSIGYNYPSSLASQWQGYNAFSSGGPYTPVPVSPQTSEGYHVDPHLLEKIKHIILKDEIDNGPHEYSEEDGKIVGIEFFGIQQSIEVAQYHQTDENSDVENYSSHDSHGDFANSHSDYYYSGHPKSYQPPSNKYGSTSDESHQSSSYDVPIESSYDVAPHSGPESDSSLSYNNAPVLSVPPSSAPEHSIENHNSYNTLANVDGPPSNPGSSSSSYEEHHSVNTRKARRTVPFYSAPYRPVFNFRY